MKKILALVLVALLALPMTLEAKSLEKQRKDAVEKQRKEVLKRLKKEKWALLGSSKSLDVALLDHWMALDALGEDGHEVVGISTKTQSKNVGQQMATNAACVNYSQEAGSTLKGKVISDMSGSGVDVDAEFENFFAAYERAVDKEIRGEMKPSFNLIRTNPDGTYEVQAFYIINESAAHKARIRALENALKESEVAADHARKLSQFINE